MALKARITRVGKVYGPPDRPTVKDWSFVGSYDSEPWGIEELREMSEQLAVLSLLSTTTDLLPSSEGEG